MDIYHLKELLIGIDIKKKPCEEGPKPGLFAVCRGVENPPPPFFRGMIVVRFLKFRIPRNLSQAGFSWNGLKPMWVLFPLLM